jgi:hypothetical protein
MHSISSQFLRMPPQCYLSIYALMYGKTTWAEIGRDATASSGARDHINRALTEIQGQTSAIINLTKDQIQEGSKKW